jgi:diguanylate cyclase (GGDEF)-like protein
MAHLAHHDTLTGLPNRALLQSRMEFAVTVAARRNQRAALLFVDIDHFKQINDSMGHAAGDALLQEVARRIRAAVRPDDTVSRLGGDEFVALLPHVEGPSDAAAVAERVLEACSEAVGVDASALAISFSIGISVYPDDAFDAESLLRNADTAMYEAKMQGRNGYRFFNASMNERNTARVRIEVELRKALARNELTLHYQPKVDVNLGTVVGAEALLRWQDGDRGVVMPGEFIPLAERTGLIAGLSDWVIEEACRQGATWRERGIDVYISVNLPAIFWQPTAMRQVLETIESFGLSAERMMIEITESTVMADALRSEPIIAELHERGLRLAIDDFGTGHSSLSRLNQMQVTTLKIDRSFISDLPADRSAAVLVTSIVQLAKNLGLQPLAEGIETEEQHAFLVARGCPLGQGFLFSKAVPAGEMEQLYLARRQAA